MSTFFEIIKCWVFDVSLSMKSADKPISPEEVTHFIKAYRALEQMPMEDGFAHLRAITPLLPGEDEQEVKAMRQHFRNAWYDKNRAFGQFYLNLSHFRQVYLLQHWDIGDWQDGEYIGTCLRNPYYRIMGRPPAKALQLHQLLKFFENHGIDPQPAPSITLTQLPSPDQRFGNATNWGDYLLTLSNPEPLLRQLIAYEQEAGYDVEIPPAQ